MATKANYPAHSNDRIREAMRDEERRLKLILARDRADKAQENMRRAARIEVADGKFVNLADTADEPTPEWLAKGAVARFAVKHAHDETVRTITSVRRVLTPAVVRMHRRGELSSEGLVACSWYRKMYELAGLEGRYSSSRFDRVGSVPGSPIPGHLAVTEAELDARRAIRAAREVVLTDYVRFFEAVVIGEVPIYRSYVHAGCCRPYALKRFMGLADALADHREK